MPRTNAGPTYLTLGASETANDAGGGTGMQANYSGSYATFYIKDTGLGGMNVAVQAETTGIGVYGKAIMSYVMESVFRKGNNVLSVGVVDG